MPSRVQFFAMLWTVACQAPLSTGFSRQEYWNGAPFPSLGGLPDPGIKPISPVSSVFQADSLPTEPPGKPPDYLYQFTNEASDKSQVKLPLPLEVGGHGLKVLRKRCASLMC